MFLQSWRNKKHLQRKPKREALMKELQYYADNPVKYTKIINDDGSNSGYVCPDHMRIERMDTIVEALREGDDPEKMGVKFDNGKTRDDLIPPEVEEAIATILSFGARKYAERNWEQGMLWSRPYAAARRHLRNWFARRDFGRGPGADKDSGYSDLWHAATNIAFLIAYESRGKGTDDRP